MNKLLADLFRSFFAVIVVLQLLGAVALALWTYSASGGLGIAAGFAFAGCVFVVVLVNGLVALQIENNQLLQRIAARSEHPQPGRPGNHRHADVPMPQPVRVEPILTR
jgi:uncharacterized protein (DUF58 family)